MKRFAFAACGGMFLLSCDGVNFEPASLVNSLRVLAVQADRPFASPGQSVHLEALIADPLGQGRNVTVAWGTCINPGSAEVSTCASTVSSFQTNAGTVDITVPADALANAPPSLPVGSVGVVFAACAGTVTLTKHGLDPVTCVDATGKTNDHATFMWGEKRITVVPGACNPNAPDDHVLCNHNPTIARLRVDGVIWPENEEKVLTACDARTVATCSASGQHSLQLDITKDSVETYLGQTEDVVTFFFTSQGSLRDDFVRPDADGSALTVVALDRPDRSRPEQLWFVVRDDRGGMSFTSRRARIQ